MHIIAQSYGQGLFMPRQFLLELQIPLQSTQQVTVNSHNSGSEFWNVTGWYTRRQIMLDNHIIYYNRTPAYAPRGPILELTL
jgi:hypothetical protein